jgi:hypothetical protein
MQDQKLGLGSRLMFVAVCLMFICGGAVFIYLEFREDWARERLDASGVEAVATVTSHELVSTGSTQTGGVSWDYATQFTFTTGAGEPQAGETWSASRSTEVWFEVPPPGKRILAADLVVDDKILVRYLPEDPSIHRAMTDCTGCLDLGSFGDSFGIYIGGFLMLLGAASLFGIRKRLMAPL